MSARDGKDKAASPFRQESLDRAKSPEQLDDYIRVSNPGVWVSADSAKGAVASVGTTPLSPDALVAQLDEYAAHKVNATSWMFPVDVTIDLPDGVYDAHVATSEFAPISLILGGAS